MLEVVLHMTSPLLTQLETPNQELQTTTLKNLKSLNPKSKSPNPKSKILPSGAFLSILQLDPDFQEIIPDLVGSWKVFLSAGFIAKRNK